MIIVVETDGNKLSAKNGVKIENSDSVIFLSTDKPVYKPGQTVKFRVLGLNRFLEPNQNLSIIEIVLLLDENL